VRGKMISMYQLMVTLGIVLAFLSDTAFSYSGNWRAMLGVLALDTVTTPFSVEITLSIEETARAHGWNSFVVNMFSDDRP
ncbi:MFS transporter, partial [Klebsiella pneumoniae]|uniref:MFS transporter n=1 Tax=Klebsiella pneumoniae TaxID=573 RepID=UPI00214BFB0E